MSANSDYATFCTIAAALLVFAALMLILVR